MGASLALLLAYFAAPYLPIPSVIPAPTPLSHGVDAPAEPAAAMPSHSSPVAAEAAADAETRPAKGWAGVGARMRSATTKLWRRGAEAE